jgi:hypothetical protein
MLRPILVGGDKGQVRIGLRHAQKLDLGLLGRVFEPLQSEAIFAQVATVLLFELTRQVMTMRLSRVLAGEKKVSPLLDFTSNTPSPTNLVATSRVIRDAAASRGGTITGRGHARPVRRGQRAFRGRKSGGFFHFDFFGVGPSRFRDRDLQHAF